MNFDFYKLYSSFSNTELLKITNAAEGYMPEAVAAAQKLLSERQVTEQEIDEVNVYYQSLQNEARYRQDVHNGIKEAIGDFIQPVVKPEGEVQPEKWLHIFLVIYLIKFIVIAFTTIKYEYDVIFRCEDCKFGGMELFGLLEIIFYAAIIWLLFKRKALGWVGAVFDSIFSTCSVVLQIIALYRFPFLHTSKAGSFFVLIVYAFLVAYLAGEGCRALFGVEKKLLIKTLVVSAAISVAILVTETML